MIDRMTFYRSFCEKVKDGVCFHANWEGKGALIFGFSPRLKKFLP
jgi:hypothetical protein